MTDRTAVALGLAFGVAIAVGSLGAAYCGPRTIEDGAVLGAAWACAAVAAAVVAATLRGARPRLRVLVAGMAASGVWCGVRGTVGWANVALDRSAPSTLHGSVREILSPRAGREIVAVVDDGRVMTVARELAFGCGQPALKIAIRWHPGALGDAWIEGASCTALP